MGSRALTPDNQRTWNTSDPPEGNMKFLLLLAFFCSQVRSAPSLKSPRTGLNMADLAAAEPLKIHLLPDTMARSKRRQRGEGTRLWREQLGQHHHCRCYWLWSWIFRKPASQWNLWLNAHQRPSDDHTDKNISVNY